MKRFSVGQFMREFKAKKARLIIKTEKMKELDEKLRRVEESLQKKKDDLEAKRKEVEAKQEQLNQLDSKVKRFKCSTEQHQGKSEDQEAGLGLVFRSPVLDAL